MTEMNPSTQRALWFVLGFLIGVLSVGVYAFRLKLQLSAKEAPPRFVAPHQKPSPDAAFHVGIECPTGYDMKFIALTPKEEKEFEQKPGGDVFDRVQSEERRTNKLLNNAVCVKSAEKKSD